MPVQATLTRPTFTDNDSISATIFNGATVVSVLVPDATGSTEGVVRLAGDLTGGASSPQLIATGATPGTYGASGDDYPQITVDAKGRITSVANRALPNTAVTPGTYGSSGLTTTQITVDAKGRTTAATSRDITNDVLAAVRQALYPVGEILITLRSGNPASWLGFGTWVRFGEGRALVSQQPGHEWFNALEQQSGVDYYSLQTNQLPYHTHTVPAQGVQTTTNGSHNHSYYAATNATGGGDPVPDVDGLSGRDSNKGAFTTTNAGDHNHSVTFPQTETLGTGLGWGIPMIQRSVVVAVWKRTA